MVNNKPLSERISKRMLEQLRTRKLSNAQAAAQLGISETYLSRTVAALQEKEPGQTTKARKAAAMLRETRTSIRQNLAKAVLKGTITVAQAAKRAGCNERTIYRYMAEYA